MGVTNTHSNSYTAVIITFHSRQLLPRALRALALQSLPPQSVVVIENSQDAGIETIVKRVMPEAQVLISDRNLGFAVAMNWAITNSKSDFVLSLNADSEPAPDYAELLLRALQKSRDAGMAQGTLWRPKRGGRIVDSLGHVRDRTRFFRNLGAEMNLDDLPDSEKKILGDPSILLGITAAAGLYRRNMLLECRDGESGPFDPLVENFLEDAEFGLRATARGWKTVIVPEALCRHDRGIGYRTDRARFSNVRRLLQRNRHLIMAKCDTVSGLMRDLPQLAAFELLWLAAMAPYPFSWLRGLFETAIRLPDALRRRTPSEHKFAGGGIGDALSRSRRHRMTRSGASGSRVEPRQSIDAVVVSYRNGETVVPLLKALTSDESIATVTLVDSASGDKTAECAEGVQGVKVVRLRDNLGYAAAVNLGADGGSAPFILVANADTLPLAPLAPLLANFERPSTALAAPRLANRDGSTQASTHGDLSLLTAMAQEFPALKNAIAPFLRVISRGGRGPTAAFWEHDERREVDAVAGAFFLMRRSAWDELAGMDERFFLWHEDADLCRRVRFHGYGIVFDPSVAVQHELGASRAKNPDDESIRRRARLLYAEKHWSPVATMLLRFAGAWFHRGRRHGTRNLEHEPVLQSRHEIVKSRFRFNLIQHGSDSAARLDYLDKRSLTLTHQAIATLLTRSLNDFADGRELEIGCGVGSFARAYLRSPDAVMVDLVEEMVRLATVQGFRGVTADGTRLPFRSRSFGVIVAGSVLQYVERSDHLIREMARVLKPGGICVVAVAASEHLVRRRRRKRRCTWFQPHDRQSIENLARPAGFEPIETLAICYPFATVPANRFPGFVTSTWVISMRIPPSPTL